MEGCGGRPSGEPGPSQLPDAVLSPRALTDGPVGLFLPHRPCLTTGGGAGIWQAPLILLAPGPSWKSQGGDTLPSPSLSLVCCSSLLKCCGDTTPCRKKFTESTAAALVPSRRPSALQSRKDPTLTSGPGIRWPGLGRAGCQSCITSGHSAGSLSLHEQWRSLPVRGRAGNLPRPITCQGLSSGVCTTPPLRATWVWATCHCATFCKGVKFRSAPTCTQTTPPPPSSWTGGTGR